MAGLTIAAEEASQDFGVRQRSQRSRRFGRRKQSGQQSAVQKSSIDRMMTMVAGKATQRLR